MTMRAAAVVAVALGLRRLFNQPSSISGGSVSRSQQLQQQIRPRCYFNPHLGFSDPLARARAALLLPNPTPCRPRGSSPLHFSSLSGAGKEAEEEAAVLDMEAGTVRCPANYAPLSPISFIERAAAVYGARAAVVYGERRRTWAEARDRCVRVAAALATRFGVARGDVVVFRGTYWIRCWAILSKEDGMVILKKGCRLLETMALEVIHKSGWNTRRRIDI